MKKVIIILVALFCVIAIIAISCAKETDSDCKTCKQNEYINGTFSKELYSVSLCGSELTDTENESPVTIGTKTTKWECSSKK